MGGGRKWREKTACGQRGRWQLEAVAVRGSGSERQWQLEAVVAVAALAAADARAWQSPRANRALSQKQKGQKRSLNTRHDLVHERFRVRAQDVGQHTTADTPDTHPDK